jgi:hypothetical protein
MKKEPLFSHGRVVHIKNAHVLKYAAEKYQSICGKVWDTRISYDFTKMEKDLKYHLSRIREARKVKMYIEEWMDLAIK